MNRRISLALIAATSTLLASVTPAMAQSDAGSSGSSDSSTEATAPEDETEDPDVEVEQGSQMMGPLELASSIATGNGSSGMPDDWSGHDEDDSDNGNGDNGEGTNEEEELNLDDYPEWMHSSLAPSEEVETLFVVLNAILAVGGALTQAAVVLAPFIGLDRVRAFLTDLGINLDA